MKKLSVILIIAALVSLLAVAVSAAPSEPVITLQPQNYVVPEGGDVRYTVRVYSESPITAVTWYLIYNGQTYNISEYEGTPEWVQYAGNFWGGYHQDDSSEYEYFFSGIRSELDGAMIYCVLEDGHYSVTSEAALIQVSGTAEPPEITGIVTSMEVYVGEPLQLYCDANSPYGYDLEYIWYETPNGDLPLIKAILTDDAMTDTLTVDTTLAGVSYYICRVSDSNGGMVYSSAVKVLVIEKEPAGEPPRITTEVLPDATVGEYYGFGLKYTGEDVYFTLYFNPGEPNELAMSGITVLDTGFLMGIPENPGTYTFAVCASNAFGEGYAVLKLTVNEPVKDEDLEGVSPWAKDEVKAAISAGLVPEELRKNYTSPVKRGEVAKLFMNLLEKASGKTVSTILMEKGIFTDVDDKPFTDTDDVDVICANALGIIKGTGDNKFSPDGLLKRAHITAIINRIAGVMGHDTTGYGHNFTDITANYAWVDSELGWSVANGIIKGVGGNKFNPGGDLTLEQTILIVYRAYNVLK